jgi:DNA modification methylase
VTSRILEGDCVELMRGLDAASVDAVVCDPPYGLEFMGKDWDRFAVGRSAAYGKGGELHDPEVRRGKGGELHDPEVRRGKGGAGPSYTARPAKRCRLCGKQAWSGAPCECDAPEWEIDNSPLRAFQRWCEAWAVEALRVLKPGGHLLAFGGTRTYHRLACAVEDAGFEIRDSLIWLYGSGFPKSLDVSKAIDKLDASEERRRRALAFTAWMRSTGLTAQQINDATETNMGSHYLTDKEQPAVAVASLFDKLRLLLPDVPEEIEALVTQRTVESENFAQRPEVDLVPPGMRESWTEGKGWNGNTARGGSAITPEAAEWEGWGTALKPSHEPVVVARKPLSGTVAANVLAHGTGALNVDGCRITSDEDTRRNAQGGENGLTGTTTFKIRERRADEMPLRAGRWPANVILSPDSAVELDAQSGEQVSGTAVRRNKGIVASSNVRYSGDDPTATDDVGYGDTGGASRFFYCAKASRGERNAGLEGFDSTTVDDGREIPIDNPYLRGETARRNTHPTVKPIDLMRWLCRLVTPPGGTVLDPFTGSGTTGVAAHLEGFDFIGCEREAEYATIARARIEWWSKFPAGTDVEKALGVAGVDRAHADAGQTALFP